MTEHRPVSDVDAGALLDLAYEYAWSADTLIQALCTETPEATIFVHAPASFLYFHTAELCCKAIIKAKNEDFTATHDLRALYVRAVRLGLCLPEGPTINEADLCISALVSENERHAFRYFDGRDGNLMDAAKVQRFVRRLVDAADNIVTACAPPRKIQPRGLRFVSPFQVLPWPSAPSIPDEGLRGAPLVPLAPRRRTPEPR